MLREIWNRDSLCVTKMTLSINRPREGEDAMITKDSTTCELMPLSVTP